MTSLGMSLARFGFSAIFFPWRGKQLILQIAVMLFLNLYETRNLTSTQSSYFSFSFFLFFFSVFLRIHWIEIAVLVLLFSFDFFFLAVILKTAFCRLHLRSVFPFHFPNISYFFINVLYIAFYFLVKFTCRLIIHFLLFIYLFFVSK